jgi:hypothetical protein
VWALAAAAGAVILGAGALWRPSGETVEGTPRLVVDTETIDLGGLPFAAPARAVFTLANAGTGLLRIVEAPRVVLAKGC